MAHSIMSIALNDAYQRKRRETQTATSELAELIDTATSTAVQDARSGHPLGGVNTLRTMMFLLGEHLETQANPDLALLAEVLKKNGLPKKTEDFTEAA